MSPALPLVLDAGVLPISELRAAYLEGDLRMLGDVFCAIDVPASSTLRARALTAAVPTGHVVERMSAAWVHGAHPAFPRPVQLCIRSTHRVRIRPSAEREVRQVVLADHELQRVGPLQVTGWLRTAVDIVRGESLFPRSVADCVSTLLLAAAATPEDCARELDRVPHLPHKRRALERLATLRGFGSGSVKFGLSRP